MKGTSHLAPFLRGKKSSQESVDDVHHLPRVIYCGYYGHVHAKCCWVSLSIANAFYVSTIEPTRCMILIILMFVGGN